MTTSDGSEETGAPRALVFRLLERFCTDHGLTLTAADTHGHAGMVENPNGKRWFFVGTRFDLNHQGASEIANDKAYTAHFLAQNDIPVPEWLFLRSDEITKSDSLPELLLRFSQQHDFPLYAKPVTGQEGTDVVRIEAADNFQNALTGLARRHDRLLVQQAVSGREFRVVVLDDEILCVIERHAPAVVGDGKKTIAELVTGIDSLDPSDTRMKAELLWQGHSLRQIPELGKRIQLLPVRNLSSGGTATLLNPSNHPDITKIAVQAAKALSLRYVGVDIILQEGGKIFVLEVNAAPGLSNLARLGPEYAVLVGTVYQKVFKAAFCELLGE